MQILKIRQGKTSSVHSVGAKGAATHLKEKSWYSGIEPHLRIGLIDGFESCSFQESGCRTWGPLMSPDGA